VGVRVGVGEGVKVGVGVGVDFAQKATMAGAVHAPVKRIRKNENAASRRFISGLYRMKRIVSIL